jgi:hypothetical protein
MKLRSKLLLASFALGLASSAMAEDGVQRTSKQQYDEAVYSARSDYYAAVANCKTMSGDERRACYRDAKDTRIHAIAQARADRTGTPINVSAGKTPADRKDMMMSNPQSRKTDDPTP